MKNLLACLLVVSMSGCPDVSVDPDEVGGGPTVEFDPARSQATKARFIPFPNDLARDPATGKVNLPEQNCETPTSKATRENILNTLDGYGAYQTAMQVTFTEEVDEASLTGNVVMLQLTDNGMPLATPAMIPVVVARVSKTPRFATPNKCDAADAQLVDAVTFVPGVPLKQKSSYFVALTKGIKAKSGADFGSTYTWALVRSDEQPVTLDDQGNIVSDRTPLDPADPTQRAQMIALAGMWQLHNPGLTAVAASGKARADVIVGFQFTTQTLTDPLDPAIADSPSGKLANNGLLLVSTVTGRFGPYSALCGMEATMAPAQCFLKLALGGCSPLTTGCTATHYATGNAICQSFGCQNVGDVQGGGLGQTIYQQPMATNPLPGGAPIPGPWGDPIKPEAATWPATSVNGRPLETLIVIPNSPAPPDGYPTIVFGHGLGSSKEALFAIASQFAARGFASVAIDFQSHGGRAVRTSQTEALGCRGRCATAGVFQEPAVACDTVMDCPTPTTDTCGVAGVTPGYVPPSPTSANQCYAPFLSADLATTRDSIRQTVLDLQRLVRAIKSCTPASPCGSLEVDPTRILYTGQSLGSIIGTVAVGTSPDIKTAVLNVGGVGWADILENTQTLPIRCLLVNGLIDAGILTGEKWTGGATGLCTTDEWKTQPGYATFAAIGRWVLDPSDPANFAGRTAQKRVLVQEVVGDMVVPNISTDRQAALMGLTMAENGDVYLPPGNTNPSAAITTNPNTNKFLKYTTMPADSGTGFPGNFFDHPSLLRPSPGTGGALGTARLQTDAITFLFLNR
ncbi:MAG TPA: hypothetical protein VIV11_03810 [Kofleriaceae bacterium]